MVAMPALVTFWPNGCIPYEFEPGFSSERKEWVRQAMNQWETAIGVSFMPRFREDYYLVIRLGSGTSAVGWQGGEQHVCIGGEGDIASVGGKQKLLHELGHTLGMINEHCRSDRDQFVDVQWQNIINGKSNGQFVKQNNSKNVTAYDPDSIMHYPAPAIGWEGHPDDSETWTMRWKADPSRKIHPVSQTDAQLSSLDKSPAFRVFYDVLKPIGHETASGSWNNPYAAQFTYTIDKRQFFYGQNLSDKSWFIQEITSGGKMGSVTDLGTWNNAYEVQLAVPIDGSMFLFGHNTSTHYWFIQQLLSGGKMGDQTESGHWKNGYDVLFTYSRDNMQFIYGQNLSTRHWFIQKLHRRGGMDMEHDSGRWDGAYAVQLPFTTTDGKQYFYGQNQSNNYWFTQELLKQGKMGKVVDSGYWDSAYGVQFVYSNGGSSPWLYGQNQVTKRWFIRRIKKDGTMGDALQAGFWPQAYPVQLSFTMKGFPYFYANNASGSQWFIRELRCIG